MFSYSGLSVTCTPHWIDGCTGDIFHNDKNKPFLPTDSLLPAIHAAKGAAREVGTVPCLPPFDPNVVIK